MNIYLLYIEDILSKYYKTYKECFEQYQKLIKDNPNIKVKIYEEDYNDDLHCSDVSCRKYLLIEN